MDLNFKDVKMNNNDLEKNYMILKIKEELDNFLPF